MRKNSLSTIFPGSMRVVANAVPLALAIVFSKYVAIGELGLINYYVALLVMLGNSTDAGLPEALQTFVPRLRKAGYITPTIIFELLVTITTVVVLFFIDTATNNLIGKDNRWLLYVATVVSTSNIIIISFNALNRPFRAGVYFALLAIGVAAIAAVSFWQYDVEVAESLLVARIIAGLIIAAVSLLDLAWLGVLYRFEFPPFNFWKFALNSFIIVFCFAMLNNWDAILVTNVLGVEANGLYKSLTFLATVPLFLGVVVNTGFLPKFSEQWQDNERKQINNTVHFLTLLLAIIGVMTISLIVWRGGEILRFIFTDEIASESAFIFPWLALSTFIYVIAMPAVTAVQATGKISGLRNLVIVQLVIYLIITSAFISKIGVSIFAVAGILVNILWLSGAWRAWIKRLGANVS